MFGLFLSALIWLFQAKVQDVAAPVAFESAAAFLGWFYVVCAVFMFLGLLLLTTGALGALALAIFDRIPFLSSYRGYLAIIGTLGSAALARLWVLNVFRYLALICGAFTLSFAASQGEWNVPALWVGGVLLAIGLLIAKGLKNRKGSSRSASHS